MKRRRYVAFAIAVAALVGPGLVLGDAAVAAPVGEVPPLVNVLPSTVTSSTPAATRPELVVKVLSDWLNDPETVKAYRAKQAGQVLSLKQQDLIKTATDKFTIPATKTVGMSKIIGGANVAVTGLTVGLGIGNGVSRLFGFKDNDVCAQHNGVLEVIASFTNSVDCTAYKNTMTEAQRNADASGFSSAARCYSTGNCFSISGISVTTVNGNAFRNYCFARTGTGSVPQGAGISVTLSNGDGTTASLWSSGYAAVTCSGGQWNTFHASSAASIVSWGFPTDPAGKTPIIETKGDPNRQFRCTVTNTDGTAVSKMSDVWKESDTNPAPIACPARAAGKVPARMQVVETGGGGDQSVMDQNTTPEYQGALSAYPACADGTCLVELQTVDGKACTVGGACADWFADPNKTTKYTCKYGTYTVALSECTYLSNSYKPETQARGEAISDPRTGDATGQPTAKTDDGTLVNGKADTGEQREPCFPEGWGVLNPINWVLQPVKCALNWAFVPRASEINKAQGKMQDAWVKSSPGKYMQALAALGPALGAMSDGNCGGILIDLSGLAPDVLHLGSYRMLPACPGDFFAPWAPGVKALLVAGITLAGFIGAKRITARLVNQGE